MKKLIVLLALITLAVSCSQKNITDPNKKMTLATPSEEENPPEPPPGGGEPPQWTIGLEKRIYSGDPEAHRLCLVIKGPTPQHVAYLRVRVRSESIRGRVVPAESEVLYRNDYLRWCTPKPIWGSFPNHWSVGIINQVIWATPHDTVQEQDVYLQYNPGVIQYTPPDCINNAVMWRIRYMAKDYNPSIPWNHNGIVKVSIVPDMDSTSALPLMLAPNNTRLTLVPEPGKDTLTYTFPTAPW
jgi:hypothetical protein